MKRIAAILCVVLALGNAAVFAEETAKVTVNGVSVRFDQPPIVIDGRTLVPIRAVADAIGAEVRWNENTQTATVIYKNSGVALQIGNIKMVVRNLSTSEERELTLEVPPQSYGNRTLLPIRAPLEALGCTVGWEDKSSTVVITTADYTAPRSKKTIVIGE
jgi:hypothetical protein